MVRGTVYMMLWYLCSEFQCLWWFGYCLLGGPMFWTYCLAYCGPLLRASVYEFAGPIYYGSVFWMPWILSTEGQCFYVWRFCLLGFGIDRVFDANYWGLCLQAWGPVYLETLFLMPWFLCTEGACFLGLIPYIRFFFACRKFCEKGVNLYIFYFAEVIFCDLKRCIGIFYGTQLRT
jgi:hypothetical protein